MKRLALVLLLVVPTLSLSAGDRPSHKALRTAFEWARPTVVTVKGPKRSGAGVVVGENGQVVTSVEFVGLEQATVVVGEQAYPARVVTADARLKIAVVQFDPPEPARAAAVQLTETFSRGQWLIAISLGAKGEPAPAHGQVMRGPSAGFPFVETDLTLPPGSPLFDARGRLVAVMVEKRSRGSRALPIPTVKERLASALTSESPP